MRTNPAAVPPQGQSPHRALAISVDHLTKRYNERNVVDDLTFRVLPGEVFALLGPNGAGKSTTIEILEGYREADSGSAFVLGLDPKRQRTELHRRVGLMLQQGGFYPTTTPREAVHLFASFFDKPADPESLIRLVGLEDVQRTRYRRLSGGEKQRLSLAVALVGQPDLVFLDEPTAGMDPRARRATWDIVESLRARGVTVVLTTHLIEEAERLADRVAIIDGGKLIALGSPTDLTAGVDGRQVIVTLTEPMPASFFETLPTVVAVHPASNGQVILDTSSVPDLLVELTTALRRQSLVLRELRVGGGSLEDVFLRLTGKDLGE